MRLPLPSDPGITQIFIQPSLLSGYPKRVYMHTLSEPLVLPGCFPLATSVGSHCAIVPLNADVAGRSDTC